MNLPLPWWLTLCMVFTWLFILPIPGTIALRYTTMLISVLLMAWMLRRHPCRAMPNVAPLSLWLYCIIFYLFVHAIFISDNSTCSLNEIRSQWLPVLLAAFVGSSLRLVSQADMRIRLFSILICVLLAQTLFSFCITLPQAIALNDFPQGRTTWTAGKLEISFWNNLALVFLGVDGLMRLLGKTRVSQLPTPALIAGIILCLASNLAFGARNGIIGTVLLLLTVLALVTLREKKCLSAGKLAAIVLSLTVLLAGIIMANWLLDVRWKSLFETARLAWTQAQDAVRPNPDGTFPLLPSGEPPEASAYQRVFLIRTGIDMIMSYPLGVGYGRNAYGHALMLAYGEGRGHSHSGIIDWTVGTGIPGLAIWLAFIGWLLWKGLRAYLIDDDPSGLMVALAAGGFFGRMFIDSVNRDHMLILFFFLMALLLSPTRKEYHAHPRHPP